MKMCEIIMPPLLLNINSQLRGSNFYIKKISSTHRRVKLLEGFIYNLRNLLSSPSFSKSSETELFFLFSFLFWSFLSFPSLQPPALHFLYYCNSPLQRNHHLLNYLKTSPFLLNHSSPPLSLLPPPSLPKLSTPPPPCPPLKISPPPRAPLPLQLLLLHSFALFPLLYILDAVGDFLLTRGQ